MERKPIKNTINEINKEVKVSGWVVARRDHGKLIFIDLSDMTGVLQAVFGPEGGELRVNDVVEVEGIISQRPEKMMNHELETGKIELQAKKLIVLNKSETAPFDISAGGYELNEEVRLKYRYLDLRRGRLKKNMQMRHKIINFMRNFLTKKDFTEVETPLLTKSTPEGARDFIVPSRLHQGKFYALPQAPQQFKQLLMVAGLEKYFQVAKCIRDEDTRADRQPEFTQLDLEMSFVEMEDVMNLNEKMMVDLVKELFPDKKIQQIPFPRLSYAEVMKKYNSDRPDLRKNKNDTNELAFLWVVDFPFFEEVPAFRSSGGAKKWTFTHNPFSAALPEWQDSLMKKKDIEKIIAAQYDIVLNGFEIGGGSIRNHKPEALKKVLEIIGYKENQIQENFGHMLEAFSFGAPPHGGLAFGLDRLIAILLEEPNIREVIAFPKTGDGRDLMMGAPAEVSREQLKELGISIK